MLELHAVLGLAAFVVGLILIALEVFVIPGFGVSGISGIVLTVGGLVFLFTRSAPTLGAAVGQFAVSLAASATVAAFLVWSLPKTQIWNRLILKAEQTHSLGYQASRPELNDLVGRQGVALTILRPVGTAEIDGQRVDVIADGEYIPKGTALHVVQVQGSRVIVRGQQDEQTA